VSADRSCGGGAEVLVHVAIQPVGNLRQEGVRARCAMREVAAPRLRPERLVWPAHAGIEGAAVLERNREAG